MKDASRRRDCWCWHHMTTNQAATAATMYSTPVRGWSLPGRYIRGGRRADAGEEVPRTGDAACRAAQLLPAETTWTCGYDVTCVVRLSSLEQP